MCELGQFRDRCVFWFFFFFFKSRRRHTRSDRDWISDVCSSDLAARTKPSWACASETVAPATTSPRGSDLQGADEESLQGSGGMSVRSMTLRPSSSVKKP